MYGAILGDMIGAPYEFDKGRKTKDFPLFTEKSRFTDDTVMTIAVAEALMEARKGTVPESGDLLVRSMQKWGRKYPDAGYGGRFRRWLRSKDPQPYGSYGNGAAMRVSAAGMPSARANVMQQCSLYTMPANHSDSSGLRMCVEGTPFSGR